MKKLFSIYTAFVALCFSAVSYAELHMNTGFYAIRLDNQREIQNGLNPLYIPAHGMIAISLEAHFSNRSTSETYIQLNRERIPSYVEGWSNQPETNEYIFLSAGRDTVLSSILYIRPQTPSAKIDSLKIWAVHLTAPRPDASGYNQQFVLYIRTTDSGMIPPNLLHEPNYTPGLENTILWIKAPETYDQNAYCFDVNDRTNLKRAAQRLYRSLSENDTTKTTFEGLEDGHAYGYFIKTVYPGRDTLTLYSDIVYSTQDHSPPNSVTYLEVGSEKISWQKTADSQSGVQFYRIEAISSNGSEFTVKTVRDSSFQTEFPTLLWSDLEKLPAGTWSFRVRAIDAVGNVGEGVVSNPISVQGGSDPLNPDPPAYDEQGRPIGYAIRGWRDTTFFDLDVWADNITVEWARDTTAFFENAASDRGRRFQATLPRTAFSFDPIAGHYAFVFDYRFNGIPEDPIDLNFVNGHRYYRRITQSGHDTSSVIILDSVARVPDCFPPGDIRNLRAFAETDASGETWQVRLQWDPAKDPVSGVAGYTVYKRIDRPDGVRLSDSLTVGASPTLFNDLFTPADSIRNPVVYYRVAGFDAVGNRRHPDSTGWDVPTRALAAPDWIWRNDPFRDTVCEGRMLTNKDTACLDIVRFDTLGVFDYEALVNERSADLIHGAGTIRFVLPDTESVRIRIRSVYSNGVKSLWSEAQTVIRAINLAPASLSARNDGFDPQGNIWLSWLKTSQDADRYLVRRSLPGGAFETIAAVESSADTIRFQDSSDLSAFSDYVYRVRAVNCFSDTSDDSNPAISFCNRAPEIVSDSTRIAVLDSTFSISIQWTRPEPRAASRTWADTVAVYEDDSFRLIGLYGTSGATGFRFDWARPMHRYYFRVRETALDVGEEGIDRESAWSNMEIVSFFPPRLLSASTDTSDWTGNVKLAFLKTSLSARSYEIYRSRKDDWSLIGRITTDSDTIEWTDEADRNELDQTPGDSLLGFAKYAYRVRALVPPVRRPVVSVHGSDFSNIAEVVCNRAPEIIIDSTAIRWDQNHYDISIQWNRPRPAMLASSWLTHVNVRCYKDRIEDGVDSLFTVVDQTAFTYHAGELGMNYVFQIQERSNDTSALASAWSMSVTEARLSHFIVRILPQPLGRMFIAWSPDLDDIYSITSFEIKRDERTWTLPPTANEWMDEDPSLENGRVYQYEVSGRNALGQIVLNAPVKDTCDTGAAYIPYILPDTDVYFLNDVDVGWFWKGTGGQKLETGVRGADSCRIELSVSQSFPRDPRQTTATPWFRADDARSMRFHKSDFPALTGTDNETLFFRITAKDPWGNPNPALWSTDFDPIPRFAVFDSVPSPSVTDLSIVSVTAYDFGPDSTVIELRWTGSGVEYLPESQADTTAWTALNSNISVYHLMRKTAFGDSMISSQPVDRGKLFYTVIDTIQNLDCSWFVVCEDSTGNRTNGPILNRNTWRIPTPQPPNPSGYRQCIILEPKSSGYEFNIEIAMNSRHFRIGHEFGDFGIIDTLLCRSGWISDTLFTCPSGWGTILTDSTWFRIKYRKGTSLESGWSQVISFTQSPIAQPKPNEPSASETIAKTLIFPNFPNPFNSETSIRYALAEPSKVEIKVFNIAGSMIRSLVDQSQSAGEYVLLWDARDANRRDLASGVYFIRINLEGERNTAHRLIKTILIR